MSAEIEIDDETAKGLIYLAKVWGVTPQEAFEKIIAKTIEEHQKSRGDLRFIGESVVSENQSLLNRLADN